MDCSDPAPVAAFGSGLLKRPIVVDNLGQLVLGSDRQLGLRFARASSDQTEAFRMHVHVTSTDLDDKAAKVAVSLGSVPVTSTWGSG